MLLVIAVFVVIFGVSLSVVSAVEHAPAVGAVCGIVVGAGLATLRCAVQDKRRE